MGCFETIIFAAPGRDEAHTQLRRSIAESDLGDVAMMLHPPEVSAWEHWEAVHRRAAAAKTPFVLVLEDDVLVNRHIRHNIETWEWKDHPSFGAGWLFNVGGYNDGQDCWLGQERWFCAQGILYPTRRLPQYIKEVLARKRRERRIRAGSWDSRIVASIRGFGLRIRVHGPPLVEHLDDLPSALGNARGGRTTNGTFDAEWRR